MPRATANPAPPRSATGELTHTSTGEGVRANVRRPACWGVGIFAGQCGVVIGTGQRYCERCGNVMRGWGREVRA